MSDNHSWSGAVAVKSRLTRSGGRAAAASRGGCAWGLAPVLHPDQAVAAHDPLDRAAGHRYATAAQFHPGAPRPVAGRVPGTHLVDLCQQVLVAQLSRRGRPAAAGVHDRGGPVAQHPADRLDPEAVTMLLHHGDHLVRGQSRPCAKTALAAFKISLA